LVKTDINKVKTELERLSVPKYQKTLDKWTGEKIMRYSSMPLYRLPKKVNWNALKKAYEYDPKNFEELISVEGIGGATLRGLTLVSDLIYGEEPSWKDPVKYSFAYGGKDGVPYPVDREAMDKSISFLHDIVENIENKEKKKALERLKNFSVKKK